MGVTFIDSSGTEFPKSAAGHIGDLIEDQASGDEFNLGNLVEIAHLDVGHAFLAQSTSTVPSRQADYTLMYHTRDDALFNYMLY